MFGNVGMRGGIARLRTVALFVGVAACTAETGRGASLAGAGCEIAERPTPLAAELRESSGITASRTQAGVFWTHNDGEDPGLIYAVDVAGRLLGTTRVTGAEQDDWEDIATGPCSAGSCLYIGDIGNNNVKGNRAAIVRVPEPAPGAPATAAAERFPIRYPDGSYDAEALFVLPDGTVYIITKGEDRAITLYRYPGPLRAGETVELEPVRTLREGAVPREAKVTGADATPDGAWVAVRSYGELLVFRTAELLAPQGRPTLRVNLAPLEERQGEGVTIAANGAVALTSEGSKKMPATITVLACRLPGSENTG